MRAPRSKPEPAGGFYRLGGKPKWARELIQKRKQYMAAARLFA